MEDIKILENMLNTTRTNRRGKKEIRFEVNSNYYKAIENLIARNKDLETINKMQEYRINEKIEEIKRI